MFRDIKVKYCIIAIFSSAFLAFGLYNVHSLVGVTEGGVVGLNLLLEHWFHISPAVTNFVANVICYLLGWKLLGRKFIIYSAVATVSFSLSYAIIEQFPPLVPQLANMPLVRSHLLAAEHRQAWMGPICQLAFPVSTGQVGKASRGGLGRPFHPHLVHLHAHSHPITQQAPRSLGYRPEARRANLR